jgi:hypothetical protein
MSFSTGDSVQVVDGSSIEVYRQDNDHCRIIEKESFDRRQNGEGYIVGFVTDSPAVVALRMQNCIVAVERTRFSDLTKPYCKREVLPPGGSVSASGRFTALVALMANRQIRLFLRDSVTNKEWDLGGIDMPSAPLFNRDNCLYAVKAGNIVRFCSLDTEPTPSVVLSGKSNIMAFAVDKAGTMVAIVDGYDNLSVYDHEQLVSEMNIRNSDVGRTSVGFERLLAFSDTGDRLALFANQTMSVWDWHRYDYLHHRFESRERIVVCQ